MIDDPRQQAPGQDLDEEQIEQAEIDGNVDRRPGQRDPGAEIQGNVDRQP